METSTGILLGLGIIAAAVFISRQQTAVAQAQVTALKKQASAGASLGDFLSVGITAAKLI